MDGFSSDLHLSSPFDQIMTQLDHSDFHLESDLEISDMSNINGMMGIGTSDAFELSNQELIEIVREGYKTAAAPYREQKDTAILHIPVFSEWLSLVPKGGVVAELGSGSGYPVAHHIGNVWRERGISYIGVDLSEEQITFANQELHDCLWASFTLAEMMDWCNKQKDESLSGIICLFSVFHLPRTQHVDFFTQIYRILRPMSPILFTVPSTATEGFTDWLGVRMYWSSFSVQWYEVTLDELGYEPVSKHKDVRHYLGEKQTTWYLLFQKPEAPVLSLRNHVPW